MIKRLRILTLLQISNKFKLKKIEKNGRLLARIGLAILFLVLMSVVFAALGIILTRVIGIGDGVEIFTFILVLIQVLSIISCVAGLMDNLYTAKDNPILLSYPASPNEVFICKLIVYYFYDLLKSFFFFLPLLIGFGFVFQLFSFFYIVSTLIFVFLLPAFPVLIAALLTMPLIYIKKIIQNNPILKAIGIVGLLSALFFIIQKLIAILPVPLRILAMYDIFVDLIKDFIDQVNRVALFYNNLGHLFFGVEIALNYLIVLGVLFGLILAVVFLSRPLYFTMASKSAEHAHLKQHRGTNQAHRHLFVTFFQKEWILAIRNFGEFINNYSFMVATPYVFYIMMSIFASVDRNQLGNILMVVFSLTITLLMATASNTASAMAVTSEGSEFALLKIAPGKTHHMAWAKIIFNVIFSTLMIVLSYLLFLHLTTRINDVTPWYVMMIASIFINVGLIVWSFQIDMLQPNLREYAASGAMAHQKNYSRSIKIGFGWTLILSLVFILFLFDKSTATSITYVKILVVALVFFVVRLWLFSKNLKAYFKEIEL